MDWGWGCVRGDCNVSVAAGMHGGVQDTCEGVGTCADGQVGPHGQWDGQAACMEGGMQGIGRRDGGGW